MVFKELKGRETMLVASNEEKSRSLTQRPAVARRQLHASIGAIVVIALVAVAAAVSLRGSPPDGQVAANAQKKPIIVKTVVRQTPSQRLQATDQAHNGRGS